MYQVQGQIAKIAKDKQDQVHIYLSLEIDGMEEEAKKIYTMNEYRENFPQGLYQNDSVSCYIHQDSMGIVVGSVTLS